MHDLTYDPKHPERGWQPAVPLPYYRRPWWRLFRRIYVCRCGRQYLRLWAYRYHYRAEHLETR